MESQISEANSHDEIFASQISTSFQFISVGDILIMAISCYFGYFNQNEVCNPDLELPPTNTVNFPDSVP